MKGSLPCLAQRDTVSGDTCRMSATSAVSRKLGLSIVALPRRLVATVRPFVDPDSAGVPEPGMDRLFVDRDDADVRRRRCCRSPAHLRRDEEPCRAATATATLCLQSARVPPSRHVQDQLSPLVVERSYTC